MKSDRNNKNEISGASTKGSINDYSITIEKADSVNISKESGYKEEIVIGNADIGSAIQYLSPNRFNHLLNDRRTDVYSEFEGLDIKARKDTVHL